MSSAFLDGCRWLAQHQEMLRTEAEKIVAASYRYADKGVFGRPGSVGNARLDAWLNHLRLLGMRAPFEERKEGEEILKGVKEFFLGILNAEIAKARKEYERSKG